MKTLSEDTKTFKLWTDRQMYRKHKGSHILSTSHSLLPVSFSTKKLRWHFDLLFPYMTLSTRFVQKSEHDWREICCSRLPVEGLSGGVRSVSEQRYACARPPVNGDCCARPWEMTVSKAELAGGGAEQHSSVLLHTEIMSSLSSLFFF